ncbi:unnamed protein product [Dibothriocephalus latus]|uniref:Uncharacterized protein n=1 Tax=Dibothriocephalus latus TaxID=60516 RepID=A0A3P7LDZ8_DIBLA|nr:unnamed protein product [Dibothriocephalus latus]
MIDGQQKFHEKTVDNGHNNLLELEEETEVNAVTVPIKLPTYGVRDPNVWFMQVEAVFVTRGIKGNVLAMLMSCGPFLLT